MNLADPELELIDPTPNVHSLFIQFDSMFFWAKLASRAVVRWSKRMYSCAGICSYEGRGGLCDIALSEPLLKLRPRKDLVETLLHEMIHAYLFVTCRDQDRDGHGPNFKAHMHRINQNAGLNISIYHDFHDEVKLYQTHVWRCNGPCQKYRPHFGIVRRSANRVPCDRDWWWEDHRRRCGGTFIKIKEPEPKIKKNTKDKDKPTADITKYVITKTNNPQTKPILKDSNTNLVKTKSNGGGTLVVTKKGPIFNPTTTNPPVLFSGKGQTVSGGRPRSTSLGVVDTVRNIWSAKNLPSNSTPAASPKQNSPIETVRNVWANKKLSPMAACSQNPQQNKALNKTMTGNVRQNITKHKIDSPHTSSPPVKIKKIDDYFKSTASAILKDLYGPDIKITQSNQDQKIVAITEPSSQVVNKSLKPNLVNCPICSAKVSNVDINRHLDECLNKDIIEKISKQTPPLLQDSSLSADKNSLKSYYGNITPIPAFRPIKETKEEVDNIKKEKISVLANTNTDYFDEEVGVKLKTAVMTDFQKKQKPDEPARFDSKDKVQTIVKNITYKDEVNIACKIENPIIKIEPGTSNDVAAIIKKECACCGLELDKPIEDHLDECLAFFGNNNTLPNDCASTSFANETIVIDDDDDIFDESQTFNVTGTKTPCPCCLQMVEEAEMNSHLDLCLGSEFEQES